MRLGIDFGTTRTVVAAAIDGRYPVASFETGVSYADFIPGVATLDPEGLSRFGWEALESFSAPGHCALRSLKRVVGERGPDDSMAPFAPSAVRLAADFLTHLRHQLLEASNLSIRSGEPLEAMVAVPANASSSQRYLTLRAFELAGFEVVGMVNEPTAAAIEYGQRHTKAFGPRSPKKYLVVYDLGGGTFDSAAVSLEGRHFELLESEGIGRLGGHDFDSRLLELALSSLGVDPRDLDSDKRAVALEACREAKETLRPKSRRLLLELGHVLPAHPDPIIIPVADYYQRCRPLIGLSIETVERLFEPLSRFGIDPDDSKQLAALYVVGGATAFPAVARALRERFGRKLELSPDPHAATAVGLAIAADPDAGVYIREATTRHFGVWREDEAGQSKIFDPILDKGIMPSGEEPLVVHRRYKPRHSVGHLRFVECGHLDAAGQPRGDLRPWDEILFPYDPSLASREDLIDAPVERSGRFDAEEIEETYTYGLDGSIEVAIENHSSGYRRAYSLGTLR